MNLRRRSDIVEVSNDNPNRQISNCILQNAIFIKGKSLTANWIAWKFS